MTTSKELTGRKVFLIVAGAFAVIITVNFYMAFSAVNTFPGLEVENSYVASQQFNDRARAQQALGWTLSASNQGGKLHIAIVDKDGKPVYPASIKVRVGRPTIARDDQNVEMTLQGDQYVGDTNLYFGKWYAYVDTISSGGVPLFQRLEFYVNE